MKNQTYTCIIVEDEPLSQEILESYIKDCSQLNLLAVCDHAMKANEFLQANSVDLIFLDINMPRLNGIDWLKSLEQIPKVIFTTAYPEHAVEGFNLNAVDFLLKPFSFDRFLKAVNKYIKSLPIIEDDQKEKNLLVKADKKIYPVQFMDILFIESEGDYLKIHRTEDVLMVHDTLKNMISKLPNSFIRIHRSYLVNMDEIDYLEGNQVSVGGTLIPIANSYKDKLKYGLKMVCEK
jgi:DNA-binding LytR/AlgR family response regulator